MRALEALDQAMSRLEAAAARHESARDSVAATADDRDRLARDRAVLAAALDAATHRAARLEAASEAVEARLIRVMDTLRANALPHKDRTV